MSATLAVLGRDNLVKLGGVDDEGSNSNYVEIYNIGLNTWTSIDPVV
jgi:hypothetical protein